MTSFIIIIHQKDERERPAALSKTVHKRLCPANYEANFMLSGKHLAIYNSFQTSSKSDYLSVLHALLVKNSVVVTEDQVFLLSPKPNIQILVASLVSLLQYSARSSCSQNTFY